MIETEKQIEQFIMYDRNRKRIDGKLNEKHFVPLTKVPSIIVNSKVNVQNILF